MIWLKHQLHLWFRSKVARNLKVYLNIFGSWRKEKVGINGQSWWWELHWMMLCSFGGGVGSHQKIQTYPAGTTFSKYRTFTSGDTQLSKLMCNNVLKMLRNSYLAWPNLFWVSNFGLVFILKNSTDCVWTHMQRCCRLPIFSNQSFEKRHLSLCM